MHSFECMRNSVLHWRSAWCFLQQQVGRSVVRCVLEGCTLDGGALLLTGGRLSSESLSPCAALAGAGTLLGPCVCNSGVEM